MLFEKWTWTLCEAIKHLGFSVNNHYLIVQTSVPILDWITMEEASLQGLLMEPKVLHWKWYLQNSLEGTLVKYFKDTARLMKELAEMPLFPVPVELVPE